MELTDEQWVERARARYQAVGNWDLDPDDPPARAASIAVRMAPADAPLRCPACATHPALDVYRRFEAPGQLLYCGNCYGFWARRGSLDDSLYTAGEGSDPLFAAPAPGRCRQCLGPTNDDEQCPRCGARREALNCPSCGSPMARRRRGPVILDSCDACAGTWVDVGELATAYGLFRPQPGACDPGPAVHDNELVREAALMILPAFLSTL